MRYYHRNYYISDCQDIGFINKTVFFVGDLIFNGLTTIFEMNYIHLDLSNHEIIFR